MAGMWSDRKVTNDENQRVLIYAPFGRDAQVMGDILAGAGIRGVPCGTITRFCSEIVDNAGAGLLTVEGLAAEDIGRLAKVLSAQPPWSDFPLIALFPMRDAVPTRKALFSALGSVGNLNLLERPLSIDALLNAVMLALRARRRQYQARSHMRQLEEVQDRLAVARNEAVRANESKSRFLAAASHDLRQPFQAMRLFHMVVANAVAGTPVAKAATHLGDAIQSGEDLLNALLDVSTLEAGVAKVDVREFDVAEVLGMITSDLATVATGKGLGLRVRPCSAIIRSDPTLLKRIVRNLCMNAISYTERGRILIGCRRGASTVRIQVWDTGIGISSDKLKYIFEDFYQIDNPARDRTKGIGLGLSIVERMARLLGHKVSVKSMPGRGSVFTVQVPRADA